MSHLENIHLERAQLLMQRSRFDQAEEQLRLSLAANEDPCTAHSLLALCLLQREKYDEAQTEAQAAIVEDPTSGFGFMALSAVHHERGRLDEARIAIREAIRCEPWSSVHFGRLASIEIDSHRWEDALAAAEGGLKCDPEDVDCTNFRAMALVRLGRKGEAEQSIDAALAKKPEDAYSHANLGWTLLHSGQPKKAMEHFREALRLEPNMEWARLGIIEAMKARNIIYRWILGYFLWMTKFSPRVQLMLIIGMLFGNQLLQALCQVVPFLAPAQVPIGLTYVLFVWMTWVAPTLFNSLLMTSKFGRLALNRTEKVDSCLAALCILSTLSFGAYGSIGYSDFKGGEYAIDFWIFGMLSLGLMLPVTGTFKLSGFRRWVMIAYAAGLAVVIGIADYKHLEFIWEYESINGEPVGFEQARLANLLRRSVDWWIIGLRGIVISTWVMAGLVMVPNRK